MNHDYRKKPIVIQAFQMTRERRLDNRDWPEWLNSAWQVERCKPGSLYQGTDDGRLSIGTLEGSLGVSWDDWIIRGVQGEIYPCRDDIFRATYDEVD